MNYTKHPLTIPQQIGLFKNRGLTFADENRAAHYLSNISYYRLRAYTYPFQDNSDPNQPFLDPVSFEDIIDLYVFDRRLRILVFNSLEKIEIALRTKIIYEFSLVKGSHWHEDGNLYRDQTRFFNNLQSLNEEIKRSNETFIDHYYSTYTNPVNPPAWMSLEVASIGLLSKFFLNLKKGPEKIKIAQEFGLNRPEILESWIYSIANLRNICAHHGRLWNRRMTITPQIPYNTIFPFLANQNIFNNKIYAILSCMIYILRIISPGYSFVTEFKKLIKTSHLIDLHEMGFPPDWEHELLWQS